MFKSQSQEMMVEDQEKSRHPVFSGEGAYLIWSYHNYKLQLEKKEIKSMDWQLEMKQKQVETILRTYGGTKSPTLLDLGCANGFFSFLSHFLGFKTTGVDHDQEYIEKLKSLTSSDIDWRLQKFSQVQDRHSVVLALALIHWIWSATEYLGSFDKIFNKLSLLTRDLLILEWVDPSDPCLLDFHHTRFNKSCQQEEYTKENFLKALVRYFPYWREVRRDQTLQPSRSLFVCARQPWIDRLPDKIIGETNFTSNLTFEKASPDDDIKVEKKKASPDDDIKVEKKILNNDFHVYEREKAVYEYLQDLQGKIIPRLFIKNTGVSDIFPTLSLSFVGEPLTPLNVPEDAVDQAEEIDRLLAEKGVTPLDYELHVDQEGKIRLVDLAWWEFPEMPEFDQEEGALTNQKPQASHRAHWKGGVKRRVENIKERNLLWPQGGFNHLPHLVVKKEKENPKTYESLCQEISDINEHLPILKEYAEKCQVIMECGVREVISSYAFAEGLKATFRKSCDQKPDAPKGTLLMNDVLPMPEDCRKLKEAYPEVTFRYFQKNDLDLSSNFRPDLVFLDTWHVYGHLKRELTKFSQMAQKYIILHDTEVDGLGGESLRAGEGLLELKWKGLIMGYTLEEMLKGLKPALEEFLQTNPEWQIEKQLTNNNGLTILARR